MKESAAVQRVQLDQGKEIGKEEVEGLGEKGKKHTAMEGQGGRDSAIWRDRPPFHGDGHAKTHGCS